MNIPEKLRELADEFELRDKKIEVPTGGITISEAVRIVRQVMPKGHFAIYMTVNSHDDGDNSVMWGIGTAEKHYSDCGTLAAVVQSVVNSKSHKSDDLDAISAVLDSLPMSPDNFVTPIHTEEPPF